MQFKNMAELITHTEKILKTAGKIQRELADDNISNNHGNFLPNHYIAEKNVQDLNEFLNFLKMCNAEGIDLTAEHDFGENYCFSFGFFPYNGEPMYSRFYLKDDDWLYDCYYSSHSDLNCILDKTIHYLFGVYTANPLIWSEYKGELHKINDIACGETKEPPTAYQRLTAVKNILTFVDGTGKLKPIHDAVLDTLAHIHGNITELYKEEE